MGLKLSDIPETTKYHKKVRRSAVPFVTGLQDGAFSSFYFLKEGAFIIRLAHFFPQVAQTLIVLLL